MIIKGREHYKHLVRMFVEDAKAAAGDKLLGLMQAAGPYYADVIHLACTEWQQSFMKEAGITEKLLRTFQKARLGSPREGSPFLLGVLEAAPDINQFGEILCLFPQTTVRHTLASDRFKELFGALVDKETVREWMTLYGGKTPKKNK